MKKVFACLLAVIVAAGVYFFVEKSGLFDGIPDYVESYSPDKFYYKNLNSTSKKAYDLIMREICDFPERILIPSLGNSELDSVYEAILYDHPQFFFLKNTCNTRSNGAKTFFYPEYTMDKSEYDEKLAALEKAENEIISQITTDDEFETELFLHDTLLKNCTYSDEISYVTSSPYGCLIERRASCEGYAKAMCRLLEKCGLECILAVGEVQKNEDVSNVGHMWDIVKINGKYYHLDPTWDDNNNDNSRLSYIYFNDNDDLLRKTHTIPDRFLGLCNSTDDNYFVKTSALFSTYDESVKNKISALIVKGADSGSPIAPFMFENESDYKKAQKDLFDNEQIYRLLQRADMITDKKLITDKVYYWPEDTFFVITVFNFY